MELKIPYMIAIGIPVIIIISLITFGARKKYKDGKKVANTDLVENTSYFKRKMFEYRVCSVVVIVSIVLALCMLMGLLARPFRQKQKITEIHNRDIFLCLDTSNSMIEVDSLVCERLKEFVSGLKGERFGITIFNQQTVTLVPLTTDYDYIIEVLDQIEEACKIYIDAAKYYRYTDADDIAKYKYIIDGTESDHWDAGSSLIGDGLASTVFQFPDIKEDASRTRVIILATDNELWGQPFVQLNEATDLCIKYGIKVFAAAPEDVVDYDDYKTCVESTGGRLFTLLSDSMAQDIIEEVEKTDTSVIYKSDITETEYPEKLVAVLTICLCVHFVISRRVKL
ncbi:MAG: VWA domain-containing protein [Clostridiales bacterium]|nr:VWA domain-containing protein [Clostridiales bacterium]